MSAVLKTLAPHDAHDGLRQAFDGQRAAFAADMNP